MADRKRRSDPRSYFKPQGYLYPGHYKENEIKRIFYGGEFCVANKLYQNVRDIREGTTSKDVLVNVWQELQKYKNDWLCAVEILEISSNDYLNTEIKTHLKNAEFDEVTKGLINDSLSLIEIE